MRFPFVLFSKTAFIRVFVLSITSLAGLGTQASAQTWSLTTAQRQAYLNYYAPVIMKRADENNNKQGRDWITNFDFDQDGDFSTNRQNWLNVPQYVNASAVGPSTYDRWRIRPTIYTALIEYMNGSSKSLVLLYHVYNATDKDGSGIHDWERVEIVLNGVTGTPGTGGEYVNHVTTTVHGEQIIKRYYDSGLNFMQTATGKHVLIWQADESNPDGLPFGYHAHALWQVRTPWSTIVTQMNSLSTDAQVDLVQTDNKNVHYVFVPETDQEAVNTWRAKPLTYTTASGLASRVDNGDSVRWANTKRLTYELQDIADIVATHWQSNAWYIHWLTNDYVDVLMESPILNEVGAAEVSTGLQRFYVRSRDVLSSGFVGADAAFMSKEAFTGSYSAELNSEIPYSGDEFHAFEGLGLDSLGRSRGAASGYLNSHNSFWWQHDFFVHSGVITSDQTYYEAGIGWSFPYRLDEASWYANRPSSFRRRFSSRICNEYGRLATPANPAAARARRL